MVSPLRDLLHKFWWRYIPGVTTSVPWPKGQAIIDEYHPSWDAALVAGQQSVDSADPNDHYRPWLEKNIGRQGWDWDWHWAQASYYPGRYGARVVHDAVVVRVRRQHRERLAEFKLLFG